MNNAPADTTSTPRRNPTPILVAGCAPSLALQLSDWLRSVFNAHRVTLAADLPELRFSLVQAPPAVALVCVDTPGLQGFEMLRHLRILAPATTAVAISTYHDKSHRDFAIGAGAVACVPPHMLDDSLQKVLDGLLSTASVPSGSTP